MMSIFWEKQFWDFEAGRFAIHMGKEGVATYE